jgi:hypothetical protein
MVEQGDDHDDCDDHKEDQMLQVRKEEREKQNGLNANLYLIAPFCFATQDTIEGVSGLR